MTLPWERLAEVLCYTLLGAVPLVLLAVWPYRDRYRFSRWATAALLALPVAVQVCLRVAEVLHPELWSDTVRAWCTGVATLLYALAYLLAVRAPAGKLMFTLLALVNTAALLVIDGKCLEGLLFGEAMARQPWRWTASAALLLLEAVLLVPLALYSRRWYAAVVRQTRGQRAWRYLWLVPATFYLLWFCFCYGSLRSALDIALDPYSAGLTLLVDLGGFLIYHVVLRLADEMSRNEQLTEHNHRLAIQNLQMDSLRRQIDATRRIRHDLRHHIAVVDGYMAAGEYDKLRSYLREYREQLPEGDGAALCANSAVNVLLNHFRQLAEMYRVAFHVTADVPERSGFTDQELVVLLGNLLENALDACKLIGDGTAAISVAVRNMPDGMFFRVENTCVTVPTRDEDGTFFSTKHEGKGTGLASVQAIAEKHEGMMEVETGGGRVCVSVLLNRIE